MVIVLRTKTTKDFMKCELKKGILQNAAYKLCSFVKDALKVSIDVKDIFANYKTQLFENVRVCNKLRVSNINKWVISV